MTKITTIKQCPECLHDSQLTDWKPTDGYDPRMRQYCCLKCKTEFYVIGMKTWASTETLPLIT